MIHILTTTSNISPLFKALCGHASDDRKEFKQDLFEIRKNEVIGVVTCPKCIERVGRITEPVVQWRLK